MGWKKAIDLRQPVWQDYSVQIDRFNDSRFPTPKAINEQLAGKLITDSGVPVSFVSSDKFDAIDNYEQRIQRSGEISTRPGNFHDLFNAFVWSRYPKIKAAMNAAHCRELTVNPGSKRSKCQDALTLFDECGLVIVSSNHKMLEQLAQHDWDHVFQENPADWDSGHSIFIVGHALLEKYLRPYKAITAQALLIRHVDRAASMEREAMIILLDRVLANTINKGNILNTTHSLSALPLAGIPGWWPVEEQVDRGFYSDRDVFRPLGSRRPAAPVYTLDLLKASCRADQSGNRCA